MNDLIERLRALSRYEHSDYSIGDEAAAALEAAREDAERYRWLREHDDRNLWEFKGAYHDIAELKRGKDLDVAIDKARGGCGEGAALDAAQTDQQQAEGGQTNA